MDRRTRNFPGKTGRHAKDTGKGTSRRKGGGEGETELSVPAYVDQRGGLPYVLLLNSPGGMVSRVDAERVPRPRPLSTCVISVEI